MASSAHSFEVQAGKTSIVEVRPAVGGDSLGSRGGSGEATGALEVHMVDAESGQPVGVGPLYLIGPDGSVREVAIDKQTGKGTLDAVPVGTYELSLQRPSKPSNLERRLNGQLLFASSSAKLPQTGPAQLIAVIQQIEDLRKQRSDRSIYRLTSHGYTDDVGGSTANHTLSLARAKAAKDALDREKQQRGITWLELTTKAHGELPGSDAETRRQNRRVDFTLRIPS